MPDKKSGTGADACRAQVSISRNFTTSASSAIRMIITDNGDTMIVIHGQVKRIGAIAVGVRYAQNVDPGSELQTICAHRSACRH